jgi:hypothetical protein
MRAGGRKGSGFVFEPGLFDGHVLELTGIEDFAALQALYKFGVFVPRDDLDTRVFALSHAFALIVGWSRRDGSHKSGLLRRAEEGSGKSPEIGRIVRPAD